MTTVPEDTRSTRLDRLAIDGGQFAILALDHVRSFATTLRPDDPDSLGLDEMRGTKDRLIDALAPHASAVLIDPVHATSRLEAQRPIAAGLIVGIEDGDYASAASAPRLLPGWSVERAAALGADALKISVGFDPLGDTSAATRFVADTIRECERVGLPLFCEPLADVRRGDVRAKVLAGVRLFGALGPDVLKIQFPFDTSADASRTAWTDACEEADELCPVPWALLSEGRTYEEFRELLGIACRAGASGFLAGRAIWGGAIAPRGVEDSAGRLEELRSIASGTGAPWRVRRLRRTGGGDASHD